MSKKEGDREGMGDRNRRHDKGWCSNRVQVEGAEGKEAHEGRKWIRDGKTW